MEKWQENRNYRKIRDENGTVIANIITVDGRDVAVTEDVFAAYAQMDRRERYLSEDLPTGKVLSMEQMAEDGVLPDYVGAETAPSAEDCVLARESEREREELTSLLLAALIIESLLGFTPREMAVEFFIFMLGCAYAVLSDLRAGIWDRHLKANTKTNAAVSVVGGAAVLVWGLIKFAEFGMGVAVLQAVIMGVCTWVLCFALLQLSMKAYKKRHAELENPKEDDDENE